MTKIKKLLAGVCLIVCLIAVATAHQQAIAAFQNSFKKENPQSIYSINSKDLEALKKAFITVNLHLRKEGREHGVDYKVVIHGATVRHFDKDIIDDELQHMIDWFTGQGIEVTLCAECLIEQGMNYGQLPPGVAVWVPSTSSGAFSKP